MASAKWRPFCLGLCVLNIGLPWNSQTVTWQQFALFMSALFIIGGEYSNGIEYIRMKKCVLAFDIIEESTKLQNMT